MMQFPTTLIVARGTAIVLVLLFHAQIFLSQEAIAFGPYWKAVNLFTFMLMPLLFLLSGLSMPFLIASRAAVYLYLYLLWTLIYFVSETIFRRQFSDLGAEDLFSLATSFLIPQSALWFIYALLIYIVLARIIARMRPLQQMAIAVLMAWVAEFVDLHFATKEIIQNFFFFLVGIHYRSQLIELFSSKAKIGFPLTGSLYVLIVAGTWWAGIGRTAVLNEFLGLLGVAATLFACRLITFTPLRDVLRPIGRNILQIYLLHLIFFDALWYALSSVASKYPDLTGMLGPFLLSGAAVAGSLAATRALRGVPGLFTAPEWAMKALTPPLERLVEVTSMRGRRPVVSSSTKVPP